MSKKTFIDKDNDGISDKTERIIDYILASLILLITTPVFLLGKITFNEYKIALYLVVGLSGGLTMVEVVINKLINGKQKRLDSYEDS
jgi:hypothetical protein